MKNLTDFKKVLESCKTHSLELKSTVFNRNGELVKENDFAPVKHTQSNAFALERDGKLSWAEYGKAKEWEFSGKTATRNFSFGGKIIFELKSPEFFGL
jgi:hypothetical protein